MEFRMRQSLTIALVLIFFTFATSHAQEISLDQLYKRLLPSVATLSVEKKDGQFMLGTGYLAINDGIMVTAWHVVKDAKHVIATFANGEKYEISGIIDKDEKRDIALIRVKLFGAPKLVHATTEQSVGINTYIIGAPKGLDFSISDGILGQIKTMDGMKYYQFTCAASPGNSGGPMINAKGEVIGVVSWQIMDGQNLNFAIPAQYILGLDPSLPTTPWEAVKIDNMSRIINSISNEIEIDRWLAIGLTVSFDAFACDVYMRNLLSKPVYQTDIFGGSYKWNLSSPPVLYSTITKIEEVTKALKSMTLSGERALIQQYILSKLEPEYRVLTSMDQCIIMIQKAGGWSPDAKNFISKIVAIELSKSELPEDAILSMTSSNAFWDNLPDDTKYAYDKTIKTKIKTGIVSFTFNPLSIIDVLPDAFASSLKLQRGDQILSIDKQPIKTLSEFKNIIIAKQGKTIDIRMTRNKYNRIIRVKIPAKVSDEYLY